jgi:uncharacterized phosphosugar-binding protein
VESLADRYLDAVADQLRRLREEELPAIAAAAEAVADAVAGGRRIFASGCGHSSLAVYDLVYRAGGLALVNPLVVPGTGAADPPPATLSTAVERLPGLAAAVLDNSPVQAGDVLVVVSLTGRNAVPVELAAEARDRGLVVIGVTSRACSEAAPSRHRSGRKLMDVCDHVLDCKVGVGDAALTAEGMPQRFAPTSGILGSTVLQLLMASTVELLLARGVTPPVLLSANVDGGVEWNARVLAENADRIFYLR